MVICGWCSRLLELGRGAISHGICEPCREQYFPGVLPLDEQPKATPGAVQP
jgi:hypothetical protein